MPNESLMRDMAYFAPRRETSARSAGTARSRRGDIHYRTPAKKTNQQKAKVAPADRVSNPTPAKAKAQKMAEELKKLTANKAKLGLTILLCSLAVALIFAMVLSSNQYHEVTRQITDVEHQIKLAQQDNEAMKLTFEQIMTDQAVEQYAHDVLGMRKRESCQTEWISLDDGDLCSFATNDSNSAGIGEKIELFLSYLGG